MHLVTFRLDDGSSQLGRADGGQVMPLPGLRDVLDGIDYALAGGDLAARAGGDPLSLSQVSLLAPIPRPRRNLFCIGRNYAAHRAEAERVLGPRRAEQHPAVFTKVPEAVVGPGAAVNLYRDLSGQLDWEAELVAVIGRPGRDIPEADALDHVFGYTAGNDITVRDVQRRHGGQWFKGKSMDTHAPLGPALVTAGDFGDPQNAEICCTVNGTVMQRATTADMIFSVAQIIHELSLGMTLLPGDVIMTGTPAGVGFARTPPRFLAGGDRVEVSIPHIGTLSNHVLEV
jgi:2,4-didehydro-3-deoxy-L-rhamnonate hydrolase